MAAQPGAFQHAPRSSRRPDAAVRAQLKPQAGPEAGQGRTRAPRPATASSHGCSHGGPRRRRAGIDRRSSGRGVKNRRARADLEERGLKIIHRLALKVRASECSAAQRKRRQLDYFCNARGLKCCGEWLQTPTALLLLASCSYRPAHCGMTTSIQAATRLELKS